MADLKQNVPLIFHQLGNLWKIGGYLYFGSHNRRWLNRCFTVCTFKAGVVLPENHQDKYSMLTLYNVGIYVNMQIDTVYRLVIYPSINFNSSLCSRA